MTEISQNGLAARVVATPSPVGRRTPAPTPTPTSTPEPTTNSTPATEARTQVPVLARAEPAEKIEAPAAPGETASTESSAVEPLSPNGPTRTTAYSDASSGRYVIQVREAESNDVINQYPPKELLRFYAAAREALEQAVERSDEAKDVSA